MKYLWKWFLPLLALALPVLAQDRSTNAKPCEVRAYLMDKDRKAASMNGISAVLVAEDQSGKEQRIPMTVVTAQESRPKAPHCALRSAPVEGTPYTVAVCALAGDGRRRRQPARDETGGPRVQDDGRTDEDGGAQRTVIDFDVPYFRGELPADHRCGPGCKMSIRFTIGGNYHSTKSFPCAAKWKNDVPTCCLHHQLEAECSELRSHLGANQKQAALADLDRLSAGLERPDAQAKNESDRQACIDLVERIRSAISSDHTTEAFAATETLKDTCAASFESCGGTYR